MEVERVPTTCLMNVVNRCVQEDNMTFLHSYDDLDLIAGHARYTQGWMSDSKGVETINYFCSQLLKFQKNGQSN